MPRHPAEWLEIKVHLDCGDEITMARLLPREALRQSDLRFARLWWLTGGGGGGRLESGDHRLIRLVPLLKGLHLRSQLLLSIRFSHSCER